MTCKWHLMVKLCKSWSFSHMSVSVSLNSLFGPHDRRLRELSVYVNKKSETYALAKLPPTATWGTYMPGDDHRKELCNPTTNKPLVIWIVGHIVSLWFARNGIPERQGSITVLPLSTELGKQGVRLLSMFSNPNVTSKCYCVI